MNTPVSTNIIRDLNQAVFPAFAMLAGMQLDVFTPLGEHGMTSAQLAERLNVAPARLPLLLYALVLTGLLQVDDTGVFTNAADANRFLVRGRPDYQGSKHESFSDFWQAMMKTAETIRTGRPQAKHDFSAMSAEQLESFLRGLHPENLGGGRELLAHYDFSQYRTLVDVGGGSGGLSIALTEALPELKATVIELPSVAPITQQFIEEANARDRVVIKPADIVRESVDGQFDVAIVRALVQVLSLANAQHALNHIAPLVRKGGDIYVIGRILDDSRVAPLEAVMMNVLFLNVYDEGESYTISEYRELLTNAGFVDARWDLLGDGRSVVRAVKG